MRICEYVGCDRPFKANGYCKMHNHRFWLTGTADPSPQAHAPLPERFWRKVQKTEACWLWIGTKAPNGYGRIQTGGKGTPHVSAHRLSYELHHGTIPEGHFVMHSCDNPGCVNPEHLSVGLPVENTADMIRKGRKPKFSMRGVMTTRLVLDAEKVRYIRSQPSESHAALARELGVSPNTVKYVRSGKTWTHIV